MVTAILVGTENTGAGRKIFLRVRGKNGVWENFRRGIDTDSGNAYIYTIPIQQHPKRKKQKEKHKILNAVAFVKS